MDRNVGWALAAAGVAMIGFNAAADAMGASDKAPTSASATIADASGQTKGSATVTATAGGIHVEANVAGMAPGAYGIHLHQVGTCTGPDFTSAGSHWNPLMRQHGINNPMGTHKGDLPNLMVGGSGTGRISADIAGVSLSGAEGALLDADGAAVVVHAKPDDYMTDPSGNSGGRIACGVLKAG